MDLQTADANIHRAGMQVLNEMHSKLLKHYLVNVKTNFFITL